jgi:DDE superfamily endonuclease
MAGSRPLFVQNIAKEHPDKAVEVWFQDEARVGQQGTLTTVWAEKASRPTRVKQTQYQWVHLFAAVNPLTGNSSAMLAPHANTHYINAHLKFISEAAGENKHIVLVLDGAGWHSAKALAVPGNMTLFILPPYSPELNPAERIWRYLRGNYLSNRIYKDYDEIFDVTAAAWNRLDEQTLASITNTDWLRAI